MTRMVMFCGLVLVVAADTSEAEDKKSMPRELAPFQGTWKVVKADFGGKAPAGSNLAELRFTFDSDRVTVKEGKQQAETGSFAVNTKQNPNQLNLVNSSGTKIQGIYKFDGDGRLSLCLVKDRAGRPKSFDTTNTRAGLIVLEKVQP